jgi:pimeloyl-ACP methyl ester carboxylesterase
LSGSRSIAARRAPQITSSWRNIFKDTKFDRRSFMNKAAVALSGAQLAMIGTAGAEPGDVSLLAARGVRWDSATDFAAPKQIDAGELNVGYVDVGPTDGPAVLLLHGWPYDVHSFTDVVPLLASAGYRVIVPYLRGYGSTRFLSSATLRNGQQSAVALDVIHLMDALRIEKAIVAGFVWGSRTAVIMAALWPERCKAIVAVSGYLITDVNAQRRPLPPKAELRWWYQYYFSTERGRLGYTENCADFNKLIWTIASPNWKFDDATFNRTAQSFQNPDHAAIVIHSYRWRIGLANGEPRYADLENRLFQQPVIGTPTITIGSDFDGPAKDGAPYRQKFSGKYAHRILTGIGHNVPQEAPEAFAKAVIDVAALT